MKYPYLIRACLLVFLVVSGAAAAGDDKPSLQKALATKITFDTGVNSLEQVLIALAGKVSADHPDFNIKILGEDLKLEGITRNQRIRDLKFKDQTVAEVLTALVLAADPNSRVKGPSDPSLKLVWVVAAEASEPKVKLVLITTRAGVKKRDEKLPEVFEEKKDAQRP